MKILNEIFTSLIVNLYLFKNENANEYKFEPRPNANYYAYNDPWVKGKRGFEYYLNNNVVTIVAYLGTFENPTDLDGFGLKKHL